MSDQSDNTPRRDDDDVEGHRSYWSDETVKSDQTQAGFGEDDDTEGHRIYSGSDTNTKSDQTQVALDDDDTQGNELRSES